ncbi:hypothetical protein PHMEG_00016241 [Phytophthora megakarya]|uniref:Uncharacterized protein n=1 Tax=Phytophthora megakarya TaxID=4795 RepID=A0A225VZG3_9STRA|nr:hypothetical protein PHMEG_00016241 [Phytophthora megakarya]
MQWLLGFVYEMKGTRASPDEWCMPFQLCLKDGALIDIDNCRRRPNVYGVFSAVRSLDLTALDTTKLQILAYYGAKREAKKHLCDYLNRLNGYARNAGIQFDKGGRKARDHDGALIDIDNCRRRPNVYGVFSAVRSLDLTALDTTKLQILAYYGAKREAKKHLCDYLNRLNGYARNAGIQFDKGGRKARDHVKRFLETCGDRGLERRLCHVKVYDIHELEETIIEILKVAGRDSVKWSSQS